MQNNKTSSSKVNKRKGSMSVGDYLDVEQQRQTPGDQQQSDINQSDTSTSTGSSGGSKSSSPPT